MFDPSVNSSAPPGTCPGGTFTRSVIEVGGSIGGAMVSIVEIVRGVCYLVCVRIELIMVTLQTVDEDVVDL